MTRPGDELLTDRHRAAARWLPTTDLIDAQIKIQSMILPHVK